MKNKPNCQKCYYGAHYIPNKHLACCRCENVTEPTIIDLDPLFDREERYVMRENWEDECDCEHFIPRLSEADGDYEIEAVYSFNASFACPFCGEDIDVYDIGIEETHIITCDECGRKMAVQGKGL